MMLCPSRSATALMCTPASSQATAALCRRVCKPTFSMPSWQRPARRRAAGCADRRVGRIAGEHQLAGGTPDLGMGAAGSVRARGGCSVSSGANSLGVLSRRSNDVTFLHHLMSYRAKMARYAINRKSIGKERYVDQKTSFRFQLISAWCGPAFLVTFVLFWGVIGRNLPNPSPALSAVDLAARYSQHLGGFVWASSSP
jgi:hypothetical protein